MDLTRPYSCPSHRPPAPPQCSAGAHVSSVSLYTFLGHLTHGLISTAQLIIWSQASLCPLHTSICVPQACMQHCSVSGRGAKCSPSLFVAPLSTHPPSHQLSQKPKGLSQDSLFLIPSSGWLVMEPGESVSLATGSAPSSPAHSVLFNLHYDNDLK